MEKVAIRTPAPAAAAGGRVLAAGAGRGWRDEEAGITGMRNEGLCILEPAAYILTVCGAR